MKSVNIESRVLYIVILLSIILYLIRPFFTVEITDEAFAIAEMYNYAQGNVPLMDVWSLALGLWWLTPLLKLYVYVNGNLEGIVLYYRLLYVVGGILLVGITYYCLTKKSEICRNMPIYVLFPISLYIPFSICSWSYNSFLGYSHYIAAVLLFVLSKDKRQYDKYMFLGLVMGVGCCGYPPMLISSLLLAVVIYWRGRIFYGKNQAIVYLLGGMLVGCFFLGYVFYYGSMDQLQQTLISVFNSPHEEGKNIGVLKFLSIVFIKPFYYYKLIPIYSLIALGVVWYRWQKKSFCKYKWGLIFSAWTYSYTIHPMYPSLIILITIMVLYYRENGDIVGPNIGVSWFVFLLGTFVYCIASDNMNIITAVGTMGIVAIFLSVIYWWILYQKGKLSKLIFSYGISILCLVILSSYFYVYRDVHPWQVETKVEQGIYKGLYTTMERKEYVTNVEKIIKDNIDTSDKICTICRAPYVYLMAEANCFTPYTWDAQFLARGKKSAKPLTAFFESKHDIPDVLIGVSGNGYNYPDDTLEINHFIHINNYHMIANEKISNSHIWIWRRY